MAVNLVALMGLHSVECLVLEWAGLSVLKLVALMEPRSVVVKDTCWAAWKGNRSVENSVFHLAVCLA